MNIITKQDIKTGRVIVDIVVTEGEVKELIAGKIVSGESPKVTIQIVGYGDENDKG